jgi:hypothetical protein
VTPCAVGLGGRDGRNPHLVAGALVLTQFETSSYTDLAEITSLIGNVWNGKCREYLDGGYATLVSGHRTRAPTCHQADEGEDNPCSCKPSA